MFRAEMNKELLCMNKMKLDADSVIETDTTYMFKNDLCKIDIIDEQGICKRVTIEYIKHEIYFHHHNMMFVNLMTGYDANSDFMLLKDYTKPSWEFDNIFYYNSKVVYSKYPILGRNNYVLRCNNTFDYNYVLFNGKLIDGLIVEGCNDGNRIICMSKDCLHMYVATKIRYNNLVTFQEYYRGIYIHSKEYMTSNMYELSMNSGEIYQDKQFLDLFDDFLKG